MTIKKKRKTMTTKFQARQGDVYIERIDDEAPTGDAVARDRGRVVLAYGEATGHAHAIHEDDASLFEDRGPDGDAAWSRVSRILRVSGKAGVELRHEEHATVHLPPGTYRVTRQREWTGEDERAVAD